MFIAQQKRRPDVTLVRLRNLLQSILQIAPDPETVNSICVPFVTGSSSLTVGIQSHNFYCLLDSGAAVMAISAEV